MQFSNHSWQKWDYWLEFPLSGLPFGSTVCVSSFPFHVWVSMCPPFPPAKYRSVESLIGGWPERPEHTVRAKAWPSCPTSPVESRQALDSSAGSGFWALSAACALGAVLSAQPGLARVREMSLHTQVRALVWLVIGELLLLEGPAQVIATDWV